MFYAFKCLKTSGDTASQILGMLYSLTSNFILIAHELTTDEIKMCNISCSDELKDRNSFKCNGAIQHFSAHCFGFIAHSLAVFH